MGTIASKVAAAVDGCDCFTFYGGYALKGGQYVRFPAGVNESEKKDTSGRCIKAVYRYTDNSRLIYTYSKQSETFSLKVIA